MRGGVARMTAFFPVGATESENCLESWRSFFILCGKRNCNAQLAVPSSFVRNTGAGRWRGRDRKR
jgi:hypothetical protein